VGEIRRVLNSVLAFMEEPNSTDSVVIAATNHSDMLDNALARRFDEVVEYSLPDDGAASLLLNRRLGKFKPAAKAWSKVTPLLNGLSQGELVRAADAVVRDAILGNATKVTIDNLCAALTDRRAFRERFHPERRA
jgi:AAA+ superfamily predicted ATPase